MECDYDSTYIGMFLLHEFQETGHIWPTEMIDSLQTSENGGLR